MGILDVGYVPFKAISVTRVATRNIRWRFTELIRKRGKSLYPEVTECVGDKIFARRR